MSLLIYGASDDLIEVEGDFREEYAYNDDEDNRAVIVVIAGDGAVLEVEPTLSSTWTAAVREPRGSIPWEIVPRPDASEPGDLAVRVDVESALVYKAVSR